MKLDRTLNQTIETFDFCSTSFLLLDKHQHIEVAVEVKIEFRSGSETERTKITRT